MGLKMLRSPREMPAMVLALALGVGLTIAVYSLIHAVLLTPLPYSRPDSLVQIWTASPEQPSHRILSEADFALLAQPPSPFEAMSSYETVRQFLRRQPQTAPVELIGARVSANVFDVLGVRAAIGRTFERQDGSLQSTPPIVVSERLVRSGIVSGNLGDLLRFDEATYRLVGVMPDAFWFPNRQTTYWVPSAIVPPAIRGSDIAALSYSFPVVGRLRHAGTSTAAASEAHARLSSNGAATVANRLRVESYAAILSAPLRPSLLVLQAASGFVLLLVCLNVAWLFAARGRRLRPAFATMKALGATPYHVLTTHLVCAVCAAIVAIPCAVLIAWIFLQVGFTLESGIFLHAAAPAITTHVATVTVVVTLLASVVSCLPSAITVAFWNAGPIDSSRTATRARRFEQSAMMVQVGVVFAVAAQGVLVSLVLLSLSRTNVGLLKKDFVVVSLESKANEVLDPNVQLARYKLLLAQLERRGVRAAAASIFPLTQSDSTTTFEPRRSREHRRAMVRLRIVTPSYFQVTGLTPTAGRLLTDTDTGSRHIVVTDAFATSVLQRRDVIGERAGARGEWTIVGVAPTVRQFSVNEEVTPEAYVLYDDFVATQPGGADQLRRAFILAETAHGVAATLRIVRQEVSEQLPGVDIQIESHIRDLISLSLGVNRLVGAGSVVFAFVAVLLASLGLFAMVSQGLDLRRREVGIRMALGATAGRIVLESIRPIATVYAVGVCLGVALLLSASGAVRSVMVPPPGAGYPSMSVVAGAAATLLLAVLMLACYRPVKTSAGIDPAESLRRD
jgi:putative ABC transport system permease protein